MMEYEKLRKTVHLIPPIILILFGLSLLGVGAFMECQDRFSSGLQNLNGSVTASSIGVNKFSENQYTERCANYSFILNGERHEGSSCSGYNLTPIDSGENVELLINPANPDPVWGPSRGQFVSGSIIKGDYIPFGDFKFVFLGGGLFWLVVGVFLFARALKDNKEGTSFPSNSNANELMGV